MAGSLLQPPLGRGAQLWPAGMCLRRAVVSCNIITGVTPSSTVGVTLLNGHIDKSTYPAVNNQVTALLQLAGPGWWRESCEANSSLFRIEDPGLQPLGWRHRLGEARERCLAVADIS